MSNERPETVTLAEILARYYDDYAIHLPSGEQARIANAFLTDRCGDCAVSEFDGVKQRDFISWMLAKGYSAGYVRRTVGVGKSALAWAVRENKIRIAPNVQLPEEGEGRDRVLSKDEMAALLIYADEDHVYRFLVLLIATWSRPDALRDLQRDQVDEKHGLIYLNRPGRKQTKKYRPIVPLVPSARHAILGVEREGVLAPVNAWHILTWRGQPLGSMKTAWRRLRQRAGLDDGLIPYHVRHTMATEARKAGAVPWEVEGWLGHRRPGSTERYAHFSPDFLGTTVSAVEAYLSGLPLRA